MKIAVIDQLGNYGGVSRVIKNLLPALKEVNSKLEIDYFSNSDAIKREKLSFYLEKKKIKINYLEFDRLTTFKLSKLLKIDSYIKKVQIKFANYLTFLPNFLNGNLQKELEKKIKNYDLALFPWPFLIDLPKLRCPIVAIFHDFNYKYYFSGQPTYFPNQLEHLKKNVPLWLKASTPIVSNYFIKNEIKKFYPGFYKKVKVINLGPYSEKINIKKNKHIFKFKYILCPTNLCGHKNLGILLIAFNNLVKLYPDIKLILTGPYTNLVNGKTDFNGAHLTNKNKNIIGMGYIEDDILERLIVNSLMIISPSVYEADNGPCTDAWYHGVPVAMAKIPSNIEHMRYQKVHASLFDPHNHKSIFDAMKKILKNKSHYKNLAIKSKNNIRSNYNWKKTAEKYNNLFTKIYDKH